ncbi:unnamed protein product [Linum trigynum]|uniref:FAS1 domain-containing protein n=1 Tax=Linum trigynum TaxID=586398 RepID=A0AAV2EJL7_9ROSI
MRKSTAPILLLLLFLISLILHHRPAAALIADELDAAMTSLRSHGYNLLPNAIATTDLRFRLFSSNSSPAFTLFAPPDRFLYSLDISAAAPRYVRSLLRHISPALLPANSLRGRGDSYIDTLLPGHRLLIIGGCCSPLILRNGTVVDQSVLSVDGVRVSDPDLYVGSTVAAHGLAGILGGSDEDDLNFEELDDGEGYGYGDDGFFWYPSSTWPSAGNHGASQVENRSAAAGIDGVEHGRFSKLIRRGTDGN